MFRYSTIVSSVLVFTAVFGGSPAAKAQPVQSPNTYVVQAGDSLWSISRRVDLSVAKIESLNHLTDSSILQLGQQLVTGVRTIAAKNPVRAALHGRVAMSRKSLSRHSTKHRSPNHPATPTSFSPSSARLVASQALWAATHVGSMPATVIAPLGFAQQALLFDAHITATALRYLGVPYVWGGTSYGGVDCSGFVWAVFAKNGIDLPRTADAQFESGRRVRTHDLQPGDLVFFETYAVGASHVGIYLGNGRFVHASSSNGVRIDQLAENYYSERYLGARRLAKV